MSVARPAEGVAEAVLLAAILVAPWPFGGAPDPARYALVAVALAACALSTLVRRETPRPTLRLAQAAALLPAWGIAQAALGRGAGWPASLEAVLVWAAMLAVLVFWSARAQDPRAADRLLAAVLATCAAQAAFGVVQSGLAPRQVYGRASELVTAPFGSFVNHNHFAGLLEMGAVLAAGLGAARARRDGATPAALGLAGLSLALLLAHLASGSRGGLVALIAGLGALAAVHAARAGSRRRVAWGLAVALLALLAAGLLLAPGSARERFATLVSGRPDASASYRVEAARATLRLAAAHPLLGAGLGGFADTVPAWKRVHGEVRLTHAESDALELTAETGLVGLLLVGLLAVAWWRALTERQRRGRDPYRRDVAIAAACAAGAILVHSLFDFGLRLPALAVVCASLLGLAAAAPRDAERLVRRRLSRLLSAAVVGVLAFAGAWRALGAWRLEQALRIPDAALRAAALGELVARHPYLADAWRERALATGGLASTRGTLHPARAARAQDDLSRAIALRPAWAEAWADRAWLRLQTGDEAGSRAALARARALDPTHLAMGLQNADLVFRLDGPEAAVAELLRLRDGNQGWNASEARRRAERYTDDPSLLSALAAGSR